MLNDDRVERWKRRASVAMSSNGLLLTMEGKKRGKRTFKSTGAKAKILVEALTKSMMEAKCFSPSWSRIATHSYHHAFHSISRGLFHANASESFLGGEKVCFTRLARTLREWNSKNASRVTSRWTRLIYIFDNFAQRKLLASRSHIVEHHGEVFPCEGWSKSINNLLYQRTAVRGWKDLDVISCDLSVAWLPRSKGGKRQQQRLLVLEIWHVRCDPNRQCCHGQLIWSDWKISFWLKFALPL